MLVQKFPRHLSTPSTINLLPAPKICFFKTFVQQRWVYSVVETTSYVKKKKSETYRKEIWSQIAKLKRRNTLKKESHLLRKTKTDDKTRNPLLYTPFVSLVFCPTKLLSTSGNKQTLVSPIYCSNLLCCTRLLFN